MELDGAIGPVERVERCHVLVREGEVEDLGVFFDAFAVRRFGDHDKITGPSATAPARACVQ